MNTVVITGVNGFLGQSAARHFAGRGWSVVGVGSSLPLPSLVGTLRRYYGWRLPDPRFSGLLREFRPTLCVHCASRSSVPGSFIEPGGDFASSPVVVFELLNQIWKHHPSTKFVLLSSAAVYGNPSSLPITEEHVLAPASPYGYHRLMSERVCAEFSHLFHLRTISLRIFSAYGRGLRRQVFWDICQKATLGEEVNLQGTGGESRDFIHATDIARALEQTALHAAFRGEVYNLASGRETTIAELAGRILQRLSPRGRLSFDGVLPPGTPRNWRADICKLAALGFVPQVSLDEGLGEYVNWFQQEGWPSWQKNSASG
jgi:UDP-glucose 4-epimerase